MAPTRQSQSTRSRSTSTRLSTSVESSRARSTKPYAHLAPHTANIPQSRILKKWKPLPLSAQDHIRRILQDVKNESKARRRKAVPMNTASKKAARDLLDEEEWEKCVDDACERLVGRLSRMPFPSNSNSKSRTAGNASSTTSGSVVDVDFSFEVLLSRMAQLRATLSANTQSVKLLKEQIRREQQALKRDRSELRGLEEGVRRSREVCARRGKVMHNVVRGLHMEKEGGEDGEMSGRMVAREMNEDGEERMEELVPTAARKREDKKIVSLTNGAIENDPDLAPLVKQLRSHLESMQGNVSGLKNIRTALREAEDAISMFDSSVVGE